MELLVVGTWFGGLFGGAVIVIGVTQAVTRRSIFPFYRRQPGLSERQIVAIGLGWMLFGIGIAMWTLVAGLLIVHQVRPPWWYMIGAPLIPALAIATNFAVAAMLGRKRPAA